MEMGTLGKEMEDGRGTRTKTWRTSRMGTEVTVKDSLGHKKYKSLPDIPDEEVHAAEVAEGNWRPRTMRKPFLIPFILAFAAFILIVEVAVAIARKKNGLVFDDINLDGTPRAPKRKLLVFVSYVPVIASVILGLFWAEIDHDVKRLEPFFQLSRPEGATAEESLLLEYPYCVALFAPFIAAKKRHWAVFCSGTGLVLFLAFATPLMSAAFPRRTVEQVLESSVKLGRFLPMEKQSDTLTTKFAHLAHEVLWLNRTTSTPAFANNGLAILPFDVSDFRGLIENQTWTGQTTSYRAGMKCSPAQTKRVALGYEISTSDGKCTFSLGRLQNPPPNLFDDNFVFNFSHPYNTLFFGASETLGLDEFRNKKDPYSLSSRRARCDPPGNRFLGIWAAQSQDANNPAIPGNMSAVFCEPHYWSQLVKAKVRIPEGTILKTEPLEGKKNFEGFNSTFFQRFVGVGSRQPPVPADLDPDNQRNKFAYANGMPLVGYQLRRRYGTTGDGKPRIQLLNGRSLSTYALAGETDLDRLLDPNYLAKTYDRAFRILFAFAVATDLSPLKDSKENSTVVRRFRNQAITVNVLWCRLLQATFAALAGLTAGLLFLTTRRQSNLDGEPASLANLMLFIANSPGFSEDLNGMELVTARELESHLNARKHRYRLYLDPYNGPRLDRIAMSLPLSLRPGRRTADRPERGPRAKMQKPSAWELSRWMGFSVLTGFITLLVTLAYLYHVDFHRDGLKTKLPFNSIGYSILFTYLPTAAAALIEPLFIIIGRYTCMVTSYEALDRGSARVHESLNLDFEKSAPHLQLLPALRAKKPLLGALASAILLANFLAVALSGLFQTFELTVLETSNLARNTTSVLSDTRLDWAQPEKEMFYVLLEHFNGPTSLPPWTASDYYFIPFSATEADGKSSVNSTGITMGYGTKVTCELIDRSMLRWRTNPNHLDVNHPCSTNHTFLNGNTDNIFSDRLERRAPSGLDWWPREPWNTDEFNRLSREEQRLVLSELSSASFDFLERLPQCPGKFLVGWGQQIPTPKPDKRIFDASQLQSHLANTRVESDYTVMICDQEFQSAPFNVTVDSTGDVLKYERYGTLETRREQYSSPIAQDQRSWSFVELFQHIINLLGVYVQPTPDFVFHSDYIGNDTSPIFWINYLMTRVDPNIQRKDLQRNHLPNPSALVPTFEKVYRTMFAVYLQLHSRDLFTQGGLETYPGNISHREQRVAVIRPMFYLAATILAFFIIVSCLVYVLRPGRHLVHLPTTLAATYALFYASNALDDFRGIRNPKYCDRAREIKKVKHRYGYGWFVGRDGEWHFGVFREGDDRIKRLERKQTAMI